MGEDDLEIVRIGTTVSRGYWNATGEFGYCIFESVGVY